MVEDGRGGDEEVGAGARDLWLLIRGQEFDVFDLRAFWEADTNGLLAQRQELAKWAFHEHWIGEVYQVDGHRVLLPPNRDVEHTWTAHDDGRVLISCPMHRVGHELAVIHAKDLPKCAVDVPWEIDDTPFSLFTQENLRGVGPIDAGVNLFHWQIRVGGNQGQRCSWGRWCRVDIQSPHAVHDSRSIFEAFE